MAGNDAPAHFYCSSGGNAGLAAVVAAKTLGHPCTVVVPMTTKPFMIAKMLAAGASDVLQHGSMWKEADTYMREMVMSRDLGAVYVPPFDHEDIWEGNSSVIHEIEEQWREGRKPAGIVASVGGGGLFSGIQLGLGRLGWADIPLIALETRGADSLAQSLQAGRHVTLPGITSQATTLGAVRVCDRAYQEGQKSNVRSVVLSDAEAAMGSWRLADDERILVELACGVNVALCYDGRLERALGRPLHKEDNIIIVLCGGSGVSLDMIQEWKAEFGDVEKHLPKHDIVASDHTSPYSRS